MITNKVSKFDTTEIYLLTLQIAIKKQAINM